MDGVERVMVLGIIAVIVAILSFAWSATDEAATPEGVLTNGRATEIVPLRSNETTPVVLDENHRRAIQERQRQTEAAREAQALQRDRLLHGGVDARQDRMLRDARGSDERPPLANQRPGQNQAPDLPGDPALRPAGGVDVVARGAGPDGRPLLDPGVPQRTPATLGATAAGVLPDTTVPLKGAVPAEADEAGSDEPTFALYTIRKGDTLWSIAYGQVGAGDTGRIVELILEMNPGLEASSMAIGRTIKLPRRVNPKLENRTPEQKAETTGGRVYVVQEGDTLGRIATSELGSAGRWKDIYQLNKAIIADPESIRVGQRLVLPDA